MRRTDATPCVMAKPFRIDGWLAEPELNTFTRDGRVVRVEPKVMELCARLAQHPGSVVSKTALLDSVWPDTSVGEDALTRAVSELRRALGDNARDPRIVQTIPKRGYRLIAAIEPSAFEASGDDTVTPPPGRERWPLAFLVSATSLALAIGLLLWSNGRASTHRETAPSNQVLVAVFENRTDSPGVADLLRRTLERELESDRRIRVVPPHRVQQILARMRRSHQEVTDIATAVEVARRDGGIAAVVEGVVRYTSGQYLLTARALTASGDRTLQTVTARGADVATLLAATTREAVPLRRTLEQAAPDAGPRLPEVTTSSLTALQFFAEGVGIAESILPDHTGTWPKARQLFERALQEDPEFAMARVWLAQAIKLTEETEWSQRGGVRPPADRVQQHAVRALAAASGGALPEDERLFIEGISSALLERRADAISALRTLLAKGRGLFEIRTRSTLASLYFAEDRLAEWNEQMVGLAELLPQDFDANVVAAQVLLVEDRGDIGRARPFIQRASDALTPAAAERENSSWGAAWLEHLPVFERWNTGDVGGALAAQRVVAASMRGRAFGNRDATATLGGFMWLTLGRLPEARGAFDAGGHQGQRELNLARMADLMDDRSAMLDHLERMERMGWKPNPLLFARAGLFARAREAMQQPIFRRQTASLEALVLGEEALGAGRLLDAISLLQQGIQAVRPIPRNHFYNASLSLSRAWVARGDRSQAVRVLEEAVNERPAYMAPGLPGAWWIKCQVALVEAYRQAGRFQDAAAVDAQVRRLLSHADQDHPFLVRLETVRQHGSNATIEP